MPDIFKDDPVPPPLPPGPIIPPKPWQQYFRIYQDHISIEDKYNIMIVPYFQSRLKDLPSFDGFVSRWYFPGESLYFEKTNSTAIITVMIIDSAHEIEVGVGYD